MMTTDYRALCAELADALASTGEAASGTYGALVQCARAALAEPVAEGPTDEELQEEWGKAVLNLPGASWSATAVAFARAVLGRWGRPAPPPAEGEVAELVAWLREQADNERGCEFDECEGAVFDAADKLTRAADLLEQRHPTPVPVAERLPGPEDCLGRPTEESDAGWCWTYSDVPETWSFESVVFPRPYPDPPLVRLKPSVTHWLPHYALPLPQGEVE